MFTSLRGRLMVLLLLVVTAAIAAGALMVSLFERSASAQAGQAAVEIARGCDALAGAYRFYTAGWHRPADGPQAESLRRDLTAVVQTALRDRPGMEGGLWQGETGSLAYAYPTYQGSGPKTDLPQAELPRIRAVNRAALAQDRQTSSRYEGSAQILLLTACPLPGPLPHLTGWTMTRVIPLAGRGYQQLMAGLAILLMTVLAAAALLAHLTVTWSRRVGQIETALQAHEIAELPQLPPTGERELDRIVRALNDTRARLAAARQRSEQLTRQVTVSERLAAIGRVAAGVAHEIRNPIAAMRLKAENALAGDPQRKDQALSLILSQVDRLDTLLRRLLSVTEPDRPHPQWVALNPFLQQCVASHVELAFAKGVSFKTVAHLDAASFDPDLMQRALDNLVLNAVQAAPQHTRVTVGARREGQSVIVSVHDEGSGPPPALRETLFEPFVTGRIEGTGLGLSIVREIAVAHGGTARLVQPDAGSLFEIILPCPPF